MRLPFEPGALEAAGIGVLADKESLHRSLELNARGLRPPGCLGCRNARISTGADEENARCVRAVGEELCKH